MKVKNRSVQCLVDSGSVSSVISRSLAHNLQLPIEPITSNNPLFADTGHQLKVIGKVEITFQLNGLLIPHIFTVIEGLTPNLILGSDFLRIHNASISYADNTVRFYEDLIVVPLQGFKHINNCATISQNICIPKYSEAIIPVKLPSSYNNDQVILEPIPTIQSVVAVASTMSVVSDGSAKMTVLNFRPYSITLRKNTKIASILYPNAVSSITPFKVPSDVSAKNKNKYSRQTLDTFAAEYKLDVNPQLSADERYEILHIIYEYRDICARSFKDIKIYQNYELELELKNPHVKSYTRQYPLSEEDTLEAQQQIQEMVKQGLVSENNDCSFNSPLFLVSIKGGGRRMVVDLRNINKLVKPLIVVLPKIDTLMQEIMAQKPAYLTSIDLFKGYWQLKASQKTNHILSFTSPKTGISYKYNTLPMGLNLSPAAFIYVMAQVFKDRERFKFLFRYVDDLLVTSSSFSEHTEHLQMLFETLRLNNLVINPTKTSVAYPELEFLGYNISKNGIKIASSKIKAIEAIQPPKNKKSLQRLMGFLQYFRKHLPNFNRRTLNRCQI